MKMESAEPVQPSASRIRLETSDWTPRFGPFLMRQFPVVSVCLSSSGCLEGSDAGRPEADRRRSLQRVDSGRISPGFASPTIGRTGHLQCGGPARLDRFSLPPVEPGRRTSGEGGCRGIRLPRKVTGKALRVPGCPGPHAGMRPKLDKDRTLIQGRSSATGIIGFMMECFPVSRVEWPRMGC